MLDPASLYDERYQRFRDDAVRHDNRSRLVSYARVAAFLAGAGALFWTVAGDPPAPDGMWMAGVAGLVLFGALVIYHARLERRAAWSTALAVVNRNSMARVRRDWRRLPVPDVAGAPDDGCAADLDLCGRASVLQLLGPATAPGATLLAGWLLEPASPREVAERQRAVAELAPLLEFRQHFAAHGRLAAGVSRAAVERFLEWAEAAPSLTATPWIVTTARISAASAVILIVLHAAGLIGFSAWAAPVVVNLLLMAAFQGRVQAGLEAASVEHGFRRYSELLRLSVSRGFDAPRLRELQGRLSGERGPAHRDMQRLDALHGLANLRLSAAILHFPIQVVTLWDFHALAALEAWQRRAGRRVRGWLDGLATLDALGSLAGLRHDNPEWTLPEVAADAEPAMAARGLGHPLLPAGTRVCNDVEVGPPGTFLLVTGSNMSGKSTLLRAIGVNVLLAQAGGAVCASWMRMPPLRVATSMRVQDSLEQGVSSFMAALRRLKEVVDAARAAETDPSRRLLYLLDEILQGTNTAERQVASRTVIRFLVAHGAIGAVTTHDLSLADAPDLADVSRPVHFTETVHGEDPAGGLSFDYRLRPGLATSRNALRLMRIIGLEPSDDPHP
jgi:hypothetical protein